MQLVKSILLVLRLMCNSCSYHILCYAVDISISFKLSAILLPVFGNRSKKNGSPFNMS